MTREYSRYPASSSEGPPPEPAADNPQAAAEGDLRVPGTPPLHNYENAMKRK
jgi:hypothetical protein